MSCSRVGLGILFGVLFCTASPSLAANRIFDWLIRSSSTTNLNPDIEHIPHPGHDYPATHIYNQNVWLTADATDRIVGLMLQNDTGPYDGTKDSNALTKVMDWMSANSVTLDYVFSDVETSNTHINVLTMVDQVRTYPDPRINQSRLVQYAYFAAERDDSAHFDHLTNRTASGTGKHELYMTSGLDVANPNCYPYEYFENHTSSLEWGSFRCPDARSALFWAPLERYSTAKRSLPAGHEIIPWISGFVAWPGYTAPEPGPEDRRALLQHMRLRGADGYYVLVSGQTNLTDAAYRAEMLDAWHDLDSFFAPTGTLEILELDTEKASAVNYSASRKGNRTRTLISNLSGSPASVVYPDHRELPEASPTAPTLTHESFEYLVYRPMDEGFEPYDLSATMDLQGFKGPSPDQMEVFLPTGASNTSKRALGPSVGAGASHAWWMTDSPGLVSNEVAVYSARLYGSAGVGFAPLAVDGYVLGNNGSTLPDTQRQGPYTFFAAGKVRNRLSYSQGDDYEATNYTVVDGRWYEMQVVLDGSGGGPAITRTYIRDLSTNAAWTQLVFDNLATGGVEAITELPAVFSALANPATYNGWQVYATNDTCRIDDLWATLYPWIDGVDHGPSDLFFVPPAPLAPILLDPVYLAVTAHSSFPPTGTGYPSNAFNGVGLTSNMHNDVYSDMWWSRGGSSLTGKWIKVDLDGTYELTSLRVWNFNRDGATDAGVRQADIYVALNDPGNNSDGNATPFDATDWTLLVTNQVFAQSPGGTAITNTDAMIDLGGVDAAYLALVVDDSYGATLNDVGLSEVQIMVLGIPPAGETPTYPLTVNSGTGDGFYFEGAAVAIQANAAPSGQVFDIWTGDIASVADTNLASTTVNMPAAPVTVAATYKIDSGGGGGETMLDPANFIVTSVDHKDSISALDDDAFNGTGLLTADTHNNGNGDNWLSLTFGNWPKWIKVDLDGTNTLSHLRVWNYNHSGLTRRGIEQGDIYVALSDPGNNTDQSHLAFNPADWTLVVENYQFAEAPGTDGATNTDPRIELGGVDAAFLAIVADSNHSGGSDASVGLSEVQVYVDMTALVDSDGDGMPDDWEIANGLDPLDPVGPEGADGHRDGDGVRNYDEYIADTSPTNTASVFTITDTVSNPDGSVDVAFTSSVARVYMLEGTNDVTSPLPWPVLDGPTAGTGGSMTFNDATATGAAERVYAVEVQLP